MVVETFAGRTRVGLMDGWPSAGMVDGPFGVASNGDSIGELYRSCELVVGWWRCVGGDALVG